MRLKDAMAALASGDAAVIDVTAFVGEPQDLHDAPPAVTEDYQRQVELG